MDERKRIYNGFLLRSRLKHRQVKFHDLVASGAPQAVIDKELVAVMQLEKALEDLEPNAYGV